MTLMTASDWRSWRLAYAATVLITIATVVTLIPPGTLPYPPGGDFSDAAIAHWPNAAFLRISVLDHHAWPLWNPLRLLGQPFAANPLSKVWYPPQWLVFVFPPTVHLNVLTYLHAVWLVLGMFLWAHRAGLQALSAIAASLGWLLAPKLVAHLAAGHLDLWYAASWVPWLLWGTLRLYQHSSMANGALVGVIAAMLALADLRMAFYMLPVAVIYSALLANKNTIRSLSQGWIAAVVTLAGLSAVQIIPLIAVSASLTRSLITPDEAAAFSLSPQMLLESLIPNIAGFHHESTTYLGIPALALAIVALRHPDRRIVAGMWAVALVAATWSLGANAPLFIPLMRLIHVAAWFRVPSRAWFVVALAFAVLGAYGIDVLIQRGLPKRASLIAVATGFAGIVWLIASLRLTLPTETRIAVTAIGVLLMLTGLGLWLGVVRFPHSRLAGTVVLIVSSSLSYLAFDSTFIEARPVSLNNQWESNFEPCSLIYAPSFDLLDPATAHANLRTLHTADPFQLIWSARAVADAVNVPLTGYSIAVPSIPANANDLATAMQDVPLNYNRLARLGVTNILTPYQLPIPSTNGTLLNYDAGMYVYRLASLESPLRICESGPNRFEVSFQPSTPRENGLVPLAMAWSPGWRAWVNGEPARLQRVRDALIGVTVPESSSGKIVIVYQPIADYIGMAISGMTLLSLAAGWLIHRRAKCDA